MVDAWDFKVETADTSIFDDQKAEWLEKQAQERLKFGLESREVLVRESHTTLNWLVAIATAPAAFVSSNAASGSINWPVSCVLGLVVVSAAIAAMYLIENCLKTVDTYGPGNTPKHLVRRSFASSELRLMRVSELSNYQMRIDHNRRENLLIAKALNRSRLACTLIPAFGAVLAMAVLLFQ